MTGVPGTAGKLAQLYGLIPRPLYGPDGSELYHELCRHDTAELSDVLGLAQRSRGPILELACGSGRLTVPLAARGHDVVAVDNSPALLALLRGRAGQTRIQPVEADMADFSLGQTFGVIVLATGSVCLLDAEQRARMFGRVRDHLRADGVFYVSVLELAGELASARRAAERVTLMTGHDSVVTMIQYFDGRRGVRTTSLLRERVVDHRTAQRALFTSDVHLVGSAELTEELDDAGLAVLSRSSRTTGDQTTVQLHCQHAGRSR